MNSTDTDKPFIAIACGGTGGHLFPGLAVAEQLKQRGCRVGLLISPKDVDQQAVKKIQGMEIFTLPAVGLQNRNYFSFLRSFIKSLAASRKIFRHDPPAAVLAMGGFTSAPPVIAGQLFHAKAYLHESNTIPGRANRFLSRLVDVAFVGFPETAARLKARKTEVTGTPVRPQFQACDAAECRAVFGLQPNRPTVLVVGGSQGASGLNEMILAVLPLLAAKNWQWLHLTGMNDFEKVRDAYAAHKISAVVKPFLSEMNLALGAATAAISRAGASSLAELAALRLPSLLVPFPAAADNHQYFNARIFNFSGAAQMLEQKDSSPEKTASYLIALVEDETLRAKMSAAMVQWHAPSSAAQIAENILGAVFNKSGTPTTEEDTTLITRGQPRPTAETPNQNPTAA
jgi:UDP-N-acetylglucosamine--N-acetylmuramyl-(pentapeptide) pyrophosphoryl-undecaprenol N-acetylglucosamine transferase